MNRQETILFREVQQFSQKWIFRLLAGALLVPLIILIVETFKYPEQAGKFLLSLIAVVVIEVPIYVLVFYTRFEVEVVPEGIAFRWWPLQRKYRLIQKESIDEVWIRKSLLFAYGIHWVPGYGWVHQVRGRHGLQIKLKTGKRIYISATKIQALRTALEKILERPVPDLSV